MGTSLDDREAALDDPTRSHSRLCRYRPVASLFLGWRLVVRAPQGALLEADARGGRHPFASNAIDGEAANDQPLVGRHGLVRFAGSSRGLAVIGGITHLNPPF